MMCGGGEAAELRVPQCTVARGPRAPWDNPRRGNCSPCKGKSVEQESEKAPKATSAPPLAAGAMAGDTSTSLPGSRDSTERNPLAT
jgi:hypothetical protein